MIDSPDRLPFARELTANWRRIRDEYLLVADDLRDWPEKHLYGEGWRVFGLFDFPGGEAIPRNTRRCPITSQLVARHIPGHGAAGFSALAPGTRVEPHCGYQGNFLRCHLGLIVPEGECGLEVDGYTLRWREGAMTIFDDRNRHRAWNLTAGSRVVLLIDVPEEMAWKI